MNVLPVITRELLTQARRAATYWIRFSVALFATTVCLLQLGMAGAMSSSATAGKLAFQGLIIIAFLICGGGCLLTADAISRERREGTLILLFMTRVRVLDVIFAKLGSAALGGLCAVLAFLPVLMIPVLSGGVTGGETFRKGLMLLDTLFLSLAIGLLASARGREWFGTARAALALLFCALFLPVGAEFYLRSTGLALPTVGLCSPVGGMIAAGDSQYGAAAAPFWLSLGLVQLEAWLLIALAVVQLRKTLQKPDAPVIEPAAAIRTTLNPEARVSSWARWSDDAEPLRWLFARQRGIHVMIWAAAILGMFFYILRGGVSVFAGRGGFSSWAAMTSPAFVGAVVTGGLFAWAAGRFFFEARRAGELELLVTTPVGAKTIVSAQWKSLRQMLYWPMVVIMGLPVLQFVLTLTMSNHGPGGWGASYVINTVLWLVNTALGVVVICWLGMWYGLKARTQAGGVVRAVAWVKVVPFIWGIGGSFAFRFFFTPSISGGLPSGYGVSSLLSPLLTLVFYAWLLVRVRARLFGELRDAGTTRSGVVDSIRERLKDFGPRIHRARHWTPS